MEFDQETAPHWLSSDDVDRIIENASADDVIEAIAAFPDATSQPLMISREIFNRSAARMGLTNGTTASQMIRARDFGRLTEKLGDLLRQDSPLEGATDLSPVSADSGE